MLLACLRIKLSKNIGWAMAPSLPNIRFVGRKEPRPTYETFAKGGTGIIIFGIRLSKCKQWQLTVE